MLRNVTLGTTWHVFLKFVSFSSGSFIEIVGPAFKWLRKQGNRFSGCSFFSETVSTSTSSSAHSCPSVKSPRWTQQPLVIAFVSRGVPSALWAVLRRSWTPLTRAKTAGTWLSQVSSGAEQPSGPLPLTGSSSAGLLTAGRLPSVKTPSVCYTHSRTVESTLHAQSATERISIPASSAWIVPKLCLIVVFGPLRSLILHLIRCVLKYSGPMVGN